MENEEVVVDTTNNEAEGGESAETIAIAKADYEKLNQTLGSLKRELKDLKKPKEETKETAEQTKPDENRLLEKAFLRSAGLTKSNEIELALETAKKWNVSVDQLIEDEDWQLKIDKFRTQEANQLATSNIRGSGGKSTAKDDPAYWISKGTPPSRTDVPDRKSRAKIARAFMENVKSGKKFYND